MRFLTLTIALVFGFLLIGCTQFGNLGGNPPASTVAPTSTSTKLPATPTPTTTTIPTDTTCVPEGESLGAVVPDSEEGQCCPGLVPYIPEGLVGSYGTCLKPENVPTAAAEEPTNEGAGLANPAVTHCTQLGYEDKNVDSPEGQSSVCVFPDGSQCDDWEFYRGKCGQEFSACSKAGGVLKAQTESLNGGEYAFGLCKFADGTQCGENELSQGTCAQGQCKAWTAQGCKN